MNFNNFKAISGKMLFVIAFIEGVSVLGIELLGGKIISSYYGSSHVTWTIVLGVTLFALAVGYYLGGVLSTKKDSKGILFNCFVLSALLIGIVLISANRIFVYTSELDFYKGLVISSILIISPPLIAIGSTTSILIQLLNQNSIFSGRAAGKIYAFSTLGGILSTLIIGFIIIPTFGVSLPLLFISLLLLLTAFFLLYTSPKKRILLISLGLYALMFTISYQNLNKKKSKSLKILYESEGVLGQIKVLDSEPGAMPFPTRRLLINGIPQTYIVNQPTAYSLWNYPHFIAAFSTLKKESSSVLLIGFGGGSVARELRQLKFNFEVVELDERIIPLAKKYFYFDTDKIKYTIDDARHFIRKSQKKFDLIIYDVLSGEVQPNYVFTIESLKELKKVLNPNAIIIINYQGILNDPSDKAFYALYKTFQVAGFSSYYWATNPNAFDDIVFVISPEEINFEKIQKNTLNECCKASHVINNFLKNPATSTKTSLTNVEVLTDDKPILDRLNHNAMLNWRKIMLKDITNIELDEGISIFK